MYKPLLRSPALKVFRKNTKLCFGPRRRRQVKLCAIPKFEFICPHTHTHTHHCDGRNCMCANRLALWMAPSADMHCNSDVLFGCISYARFQWAAHDGGRPNHQLFIHRFALHVQNAFIEWNLRAPRAPHKFVYMQWHIRSPYHMQGFFNRLSWNKLKFCQLWCIRGIEPRNQPHLPFA